MKYYAALMQACGALAALLVGLMTVLVGYDVVMRNIGGGGLYWILDVTEYMLPTAICVSAPWLMYRNQHIRLDLLNMVFAPEKLRHVDRAAAVVGMLSSAIFTWYAVALLLDSRAAGSLVMKSLVFPEWWIYVPVPIGFGLLAIECGRRVFLPGTLAPEPDAMPGGAA
ncbi:MAG: TRAP transporter small permease [Rubrivivax sp.]